uniref:Proline dehydrogenase n=1 Tax=Neospora caninum (strain Liverpool) TaxID=572307 RepID=A0A0F7UBT8_NEOCL|nr:TPA: Proline dehydrogenase 1, mitochondrial [Neospora caninum Liverpool]
MWLVKHSVYKVFCGGESLEEVLGTMDKLESRGVKTVLDYAVEASSEDVTCITDDVFDHNLHLTWKAVETVSKKRDGLVAVKVSALGPVSTFERAGVVIAAVERLFAELCGMPVSPGHRRTLPDLLMLKELTRQAFVKGMRKLATEATVPVAAEAELNRVFDTLLAQPGRGEDDFKVSFFQWTHFLQPQKVGRDELAVFKEVIPPLSDYDADHVVATQDRLFRLCKMTAQLETKPSLLVDAEQSQVQGFISTVTSNAQKRFNKNGQSLIYNTYQAYLKETKSQVRCDIEMARRFGVSFALKLVRGAYMSFERDIAEANGYPCPVHDCIEDTHDSFDSCVRLLLENRNRVAIFIGTHNAESIRKAGELLYGMRQNPDESLTKDERTSDVSVTNVSGVGDRTHLLAPTSLPVSFGQLLGMGDNLTFTLSDSGFRVYKYVPYGPVEVTIPYLLRRVQENCGVIGRAGWELQIIVQEIKRRAYSWLGCHKQQ